MAKRTPLIALAAGVLLLSGCAGGAAPAEPTTTDDGGPGVSGEITVYSPGAGEYEPIVAAFNETYPDVTVNMVRLVCQELTTRLQSEVASGQHIADVVLDTTASTGGPWLPSNAGWFEPYMPEAAESLAPSFVAEDGSWFSPYSGVFGLAYNTEAVSDADLPESWDNLLDERWQGRIALTDPTSPNLTSVTFAALMANDVIDDAWLTDLAGQNPTVIAETPQIGQALADGTADIAVWGQGFTVNAAAAGAPVAQDHALDVLVPYGVALVADAPDPDAAKVFIDWLLTEAAQQELADLGNVGSVEGAPLPEGVDEDVRTEAPIAPSFETTVGLMGQIAKTWEAANG